MDDPIFLPEMLLEIFTRLPAKSVGKCRCLSKTWKTQLSTADFINSHLTQLKTHQGEGEEKQLIVIRSWSLHTVSVTNPLESEEQEVIPKEIQLETKWAFVIGSCNGLVLLKEKCTFLLFVVNPVTRQQVKIPKADARTNQTFGFGYDPSCDDYKVVSVNYTEGRTFVDVYSLKNKVWKLVASVPSDRLWRFGAMPFVNGAVHWLTVDDTHGCKYSIHAFHLGNETIHQVPYPKGLGLEGIYTKLVILKGCLCIDGSTKDSLNVCVMKEYGVVDSWVRFRYDNKMAAKEMKPVCSVGNDDGILYVSTDDRDFLEVCYLDKEKIVTYTGLGNVLWSVFVETIVSPEQENVLSLSVGKLANES